MMFIIASENSISEAADNCRQIGLYKHIPKTDISLLVCY